VTGDDLRSAFLTFFQGKGHTVIPSSSLVPHGDPTLLLTTAGMVQIKPYFQGLATPPSPRLASCQKCFRTTDIDSVGDAKHLTFFEMLGNFSVGDYFKKEAIEWAWEFVTHRLKLPANRLVITIFLDDDEAFGHWRRTGVSADRIVRLGEKYNYWGPAGDSGPCGPCSEIHYDFGPQYGCRQPDCGPACDCDRFSEIWNLVFTQYDQDREGRRTPLPRPNIDTGMGLERIAAVMQGKRSVYETDLFAPLLARVSEISGKRMGQDDGADRAAKIIAEHIRGITFLMADGVVPGNDGRGYVLRRLLRRTCLFGRKLGLEEPFLVGLADFVIGSMGQAYSELRANRDLVLGGVDSEERRFGQTLTVGLNWLERVMERAEAEDSRRIPGQDLFMLYDTYGFPKELTVEIASERGFSVDLDGFEREMAQQRERARAAARFNSGGAEAGTYEQLGPLTTGFVGYDRWQHPSKVVGLLVDGKPRHSASEGDDVEVILQETPFYGEMGGQVGDTGEIRSDRGRVVVRQAIRPLPELTVHQGRVAQGRIAVNDAVEARVDLPRRLDIARNHTATHLLQAALRAVLGEQVHQSGSLVNAEGFRFDFTYPEAVGRQRLAEIRQLVNEKIRENLPVLVKSTSYREAVAGGAIALFGEKYGDMVRLVQTGDPPFSMELCGGTHVRSTGEIGIFHITSEGSIGSGVRRIEAVTGRGAERLFGQRLALVEALAQELRTSPDNVQSRVSAVLAELDRASKRASEVEREVARKSAGSLVSQAEVVNGINVLAARVQAASAEAMREMGDCLKAELGSGVIVLGTVVNGNPVSIAMVTPDLVDRGFNAGQIVKEVSKVTGGGGGGRAEFGQGSGRDAAKLDEALGQVRQIIASHREKDSGKGKKGAG
jgi:alanyl-tRNA synthetase